MEHIFRIKIGRRMDLEENEFDEGTSKIFIHFLILIKKLKS